MISIENRVGRLIEVRFASPILDSEMTDFLRERERVMRLVGNDRLVCIDLSRMHILPPSQADTFLNFLKGSRPGLTRNAFLLPPGQALLALQFGRIVREANNPARRTFQSRRDLITWLGEVMRPLERTRLDVFLTEDSPGSR